MTKTFIERVKTEMIVDTKNYRYVYDSFNGTIERLPISLLGSIGMIEGFQIVKVGV